MDVCALEDDAQRFPVESAPCASAARHLVPRDSVYLANMVVAQTEEGAVVIINTHGHDDHTRGNEICADRGVSMRGAP